ncbi:MAG: DUF2059 domain-containing protein [Acidobacteriaceae bacterium]
MSLLIAVHCILRWKVILEAGGGMKKMVVMCIFLASGMAIAQTASREKIIEMMDVMHSKQMMTQIQGMMKTQIMASVLEEAKANPKQQITPQQMESLRQFIDSSVTSKMDDGIIGLAVPIYQKHYTDGEISEIIAFYSTPTGQKMITEAPQMMGEIFAGMAPLMKTMKEDIGKQAEERAKAGAAAQ